MTTPANDGPLHDAHAPPRSNRAAAAANGLSTVALLSAVLASVVGAVLTAELGTSQLGRLGGATLGPVISTTITTWWSGGRGRLQLVAITAMTLLALGITVSGFLVADTVAEKPVLGDDGSGSLVPSGVAPVAAPDSVDPLVDPGVVTDSPTVTEGPLPDLSLSSQAVTNGAAVTVTNAGTGDAGPFDIVVNDVVHSRVDRLPAGAATAALAVLCPDPLLTELVVTLVLLPDGPADADVSDNTETVPVTCTP